MLPAAEPDHRTQLMGASLEMRQRRKEGGREGGGSGGGGGGNGHLAIDVLRWRKQFLETRDLSHDGILRLDKNPQESGHYR